MYSNKHKTYYVLAEPNVSPGNTIFSKFTIFGNLLWCNIKNNNEIIY